MKSKILTECKFHLKVLCFKAGKITITADVKIGHWALMYSLFLHCRVFYKVKSRNAHMKSHRPVEPPERTFYPHVDGNG